MSKFVVFRKEVHYAKIEIEADDARQAMRKVAAGEGEEIGLEYSDTEDVEEWMVSDGQTTFRLDDDGNLEII